MKNYTEDLQLPTTRYAPGWGTHLPILAKVLMASTGPVMELGIGVFSTPFLHNYCAAQNRFLDSYESDKGWVGLHKYFVTPIHRITCVTDWDTIPIEKNRWGVIFVDHESSRRAKEAIRASQYADYVIIHDSNGRLNPIYHWDFVYPYFKYQYVFNKFFPHTTVLSNFYRVDNLWI